MKTILKKRENGTTRISYDFSDEKPITDQAPAKELTMDSIVAKLEKGIMPILADGSLYSEDIGIRNLQDVFDVKQKVTDLYNQLPSAIKQKMGNDITKFESVIFNPENADLLLEHGLLVKKTDTHRELINAISELKPSPDAQK